MYFLMNLNLQKYTFILMEMLDKCVFGILFFCTNNHSEIRLTFFLTLPLFNT